MSAQAFALDGRPPLHWRVGHFLLALLAIAFAALVALAFGVSGMLLPGIALLAGLMLAFAAFRWPAQVVLATLVLVPLSRFFSLLAFSASGSTMALRASQLLKDELLIVLLVAGANLAFQRRRTPRLLYLDLLFAAYVLIALVYLFYNHPEGGASNLFSKGLALRQDVLYFLAYFVGRSMPLSRARLELMLRIIVWLSVAVAVVAALQWLFPGISNRVFDKMGFQDFMQAIGTPHETEAVRSRGIAGVDLARSSSLFLADLALAFYQVWVIPLAAALFYFARGRNQNIGYGAFLVAMIATLGMTITRGALVAAAVGLVFITLRTSSYLKVSAVGGVLAAMVLAAVAVMGLDNRTFGALFSTSEGSAAAHFHLIDYTITLLNAYPLGLGLGNGSHVANLVSNFGVFLPVSARETWYLQIALEMGFGAMILFVAILATATVTAIAHSFRVRDPLLKAVTAGTGAAGLSLAVIGLLHPVWAAVQVTYLFWLFAGIAVRARTLESEWAEEARTP